jgi:O-antigen ligase
LKREYAAAALVALPWLWGHTFGPTPNLLPLVVAALCLPAALALAGGDSGRLRYAIANGWLAAAGLSAVIGIAQYYGLAGGGVISVSRLGEAFGNLRQRNQFASLMSLGLAVLLFLPRRLPRAVVLAGAVLMAAAGAASASRTGLLQLLGLAALASAWPGDKRQRLSTAMVALAAYAVASLALPALLWQWRGVEPPNVFGRVMADLGCSSRKVLWSNVGELILQRPWTGWGLGELDYAHYMHLYTGPRFCDILDNAHNLPLHLAVELGVPFALACLVAAGWLVLRARPWREADGSRQLAWAALAIIGLHSLLEYPLWYGPFQSAVVLALLMLLPVVVRWMAARHAAPLLLAATVPAASALLWQYDRVSDAYRDPQQRRESLRHDPVAGLAQAWPFQSQVDFARLSVAQVRPESARQVHELATEILHYSPEPAVVEKLVESAVMLGLDGEAAAHLARYRAAFPEQYQKWREGLVER